MRIAILTNEYPPNIYGGAGVHVDFLTRELAALDGRSHLIKVLCFGEQQERAENKIVKGIRVDFPFPGQESRHRKLLETLFRNVLMVGSLEEVDLIHCHTWYTHLAGCLLKQLLGKPLVLTTHSLEPHRPWKEEQLGSGYQVSTWLEKTAYQNADGVIAVSRAMRQDVHELYSVPWDKVRVIPNGIDVELYRPTENPAVLAKYGVDPAEPYILFVGRITPQKGITHLLAALEEVTEEVQAVLCATGPDTPEIGREVEQRIAQLQGKGRKVIWINQFVPTPDLVPLYSQAALFVCPSIYEPFGIINLEAMACGTPVVATAVGGIKEVVVHEETGLLVPFDVQGQVEQKSGTTTQFARELAGAIHRLLADPEKRGEMGKKARAWVEQRFSWKSVARQTLDFYRELVKQAG
jgi:glycogen synthase|uniref:Glycogen synthase n=1 Tax=Desulfobacca acetoxidans TaxID=60893 RepID=A0A7C5AML5_9BACT